jgi:hypothetical protein
VQVYERAIPAVPKAERMSVVELFVSRATDFFGVAKVGDGCVTAGPWTIRPSRATTCKAADASKAFGTLWCLLDAQYACNSARLTTAFSQ